MHVLWEDELSRRRGVVRTQRARLLHPPDEHPAESPSTPSTSASAALLAAAFALVSIVGPGRAVRLAMQSLTILSLIRQSQRLMSVSAPKRKGESQ